MSSITITPALNHGDYHGGEPYGSPGNCGGHRPPGLDACDIDSHGINNRSGDFAGNGNGPVVIVISMPPELAGGDPGLNGNSPQQGSTFFGVGQGCYLNACAGNLVPPNSEEQFAVKTIEDFLKKYNMGPLSQAQMTEIAEKGTLNGKPLPGTADEQYDVRLAASIYTANDGAVFNKVGSDYPSQASTMSEDEAVGTIEKFQRANDTGNLSFEDMKEMAEKGTLKGERVPAAVQEAAKVYTANGGSLYDKIESANNGKNDNALSAEDARRAREKGLVGMTNGQAVDTIEQFQKLPGVGLISRDEMEEIATKGTLRGAGGVPSDVRVAARVYMADDGALFDSVEAASTGENDGKLGRNDAANARRDGLIDV